MSLPILVPLDGSALAEHALPAAVAMARRSGGTLHLCRVCLPVSTEHAPADRRRLNRQRRHSLAQLRALSGRLARAWHVPVRAGVRTGPVAESLLREARLLGAGVIVLTTHGLGESGPRWLGSVADELVHRAGCPILLLPPRHSRVDWSAGEFRRILLPIAPSADPGRVLAGTVLLEAEDGVTYAALPLPATLPPKPPGGEPDPAQPQAPGEATSAPSVMKAARTFGADLIAFGLPAKASLDPEAFGPLLEPLVRMAPLPLLLQRPVVPSGPALPGLELPSADADPSEGIPT